MLSPEPQQDWIDKLSKSGVIPPMTRRIIIDIPLDGLTKVYYECFGDSRMFEIDPVAMLEGVEPISVSKVERT